MDLTERLRRFVKRARKRGALWVRVLDQVRPLATAAGRGQMWTVLVHGGAVHQVTPFTSEERYPELFDLAAELAPDAKRILSFGCSTGEELTAIRRRFPEAEIIGAEINSRSRRIAARRVARDNRALVVEPRGIDGRFDVIFALAVLQREPHRIAELAVEDLQRYYPFERFDAAVVELVGRLRTGGLLCIFHSQYLTEHSSAAGALAAIENSPAMPRPVFGRDGHRLKGAMGSTIFRKIGS